MSEHRERFRPGSQVLAYHGPLVYEAKVLKFHEKGKVFVEIGEGKSEPLLMNRIPGFLQEKDAYFLHYKGWSPKWDEWVSTERIMEFNDDNLGLSRELRNARKKAIERMDSSKDVKEESETPEYQVKKKRKKDALSGPSSQGNGVLEHLKSNGVGPKRGRPEGKTTYEVMMPLRPKLKCVLIDDWELMTKDRKLVDLENTVPVDKILESYIDWKEMVGISEEDLRGIKEATEGLRVYFNKVLGLNLLYRFERLQYSDLLTENADMVPSSKYGLEHLLRLLVTLPAQVAQTAMDSISVNVLMGHMKALLEFLEVNIEQFGSSYMNASPQYDRVARGQ